MARRSQPAWLIEKESSRWSYRQHRSIAMHWWCVVCETSFARKPGAAHAKTSGHRRSQAVHDSEVALDAALRLGWAPRTRHQLTAASAAIAAGVAYTLPEELKALVAPNVTPTQPIFPILLRDFIDRFDDVFSARVAAMRAEHAACLTALARQGEATLLKCARAIFAGEGSISEEERAALAAALAAISEYDLARRAR